MKHLRRMSWAIPMLFAASLLAACGGGGGSSPPPPPPPPPPVAPSGLSYVAPQPFTVNTAIAALAPTVTGTVTGYAVAPALPAGLAISATTGAISGTPTAITATANYVVTASNSAGNTTATLSLTVNDARPIVAYSGGGTFTFTKGVAVNLAPNNTGGAVLAWSVNPALPAGLAFSATTGAITGTPTAITAAANYVVTASNSGVTQRPHWRSP